MSKMMIIIACFLALATCSNASTRILAGENAQRGQFPHQVSVQIDGQHKCGGSILSETKILTAAQCLNRIEGVVTVKAGVISIQEPGNIFNVEKFILHDRWNEKTIVNDIAVITLSSPITFTETIQPIKLSDRKLTSGENVIFSGWGVTKVGGSISDILQWVQLKFVDLNTCAIQMEGQKPITYGHICTKTTWYQGICHGDSGSALVDAEGFQVGVASWAVPCGLNKPDIYSSVKYFYDWINKQL